MNKVREADSYMRRQYDILLLMPPTRYYHLFSEIRKKKPDFLGGHITLQDV